MTQANPSFLRRIGIAFSGFFSLLGNAELAGRYQRLRAGEEAVEQVETEAPPAAATTSLHEAPHEAALQLLGMLQREARFIDFVEEEIASYSDADIGAAARIVHEGCRKALREHFSIEPVHSEPEGSRITVAVGFDAAAVRLTGRVVGDPPFSGTLAHRGWRVTETRLPMLANGHDVSIVAQAEVEL